MAPGASRPSGRTKGTGVTTTNPRWAIWRNSGRFYFANTNGGEQPTKMSSGLNGSWSDGGGCERGQVNRGMVGRGSVRADGWRVTSARAEPRPTRALPYHQKQTGGQNTDRHLQRAE